MTKSKEWLIYNAVKCWLHYCSTTTEFTEEYYKLRDEYDGYRDWETDRKSTRLNSSHRL